MNLPDINLIRYFLVTARTLNYSAASRELYISRQALTKNIRHMEEMLGGPLFVQESGHLSLTHLGMQFQQAAIPLMMSWDVFSKKMQNLTDSNRPLLRMAASQGTILSLGGHFTPEFRKMYPDIMTSLEEALAENVCSMVNLGTVDLVLIGSHPMYLSAFDVYPIRMTGVWLLMHKSQPLSHNEIIGIEDLKNANFLTPGLHNHLYRYFLESCREYGVQPNIVGQASYSFDFGMKLADPEVIYFGFAPEIITPPEDWCVRPMNFPGSEKFGTYLIKRSGAPISSAESKMIQFIKERFSVE